MEREEEKKEPTALTIKNLTVSYGNKVAINNVSIDIPKNSITAIIGASGSGKSTLLKSINRMLEPWNQGKDESKPKVRGEIIFSGQNVYERNVDPVELRAAIGIIFQKPNPFPKSIFENVAFGPKIRGIKKDNLEELVENKLKRANLWEEVKDRLHEPALGLSGGQQQRLCIARTLAIEPKVILMDEPCSALDPIATLKVEDLMQELSQDHAVVVVTHNMSQARRVSDQVAYIGFRETGGELVEFSKASKMFLNPENQETEDFINGKFG